MNKKKKTQNDVVLAWLKMGRKITTLEAFKKWGITRLAARCFELRKQGWDIKSETAGVNGANYARYSLHKKG